MNVIQTNLAMLAKRRLVIGFEGENERTRLRIDSADLFEEYPNAYPSLVVKPLHEEAYPSIVTKDGDDVVWDVTADILSFVGDGEIQLTFTSGNTIAKTVIGKIRVNRSLNPSGDPPEHLETWYEGANAKLAEVDEAVNALEAIDAIAYSLPAGSDPTVELHDVEALGHKRFTFQIPKGDKGDRGYTGNGIRSISQSGSTGLYKKYTIHFTDGTTTTFQVRDGDRGLKGDTGATPDISIGTVQTLPAGSEATASMSGTAEEPLLNLGIPKGETGATGERGEKGDPGSMGPAGPAGSTGPQGPKGDPGDPGRGIARVTKIATVELVDTYQITFTDGSTFPFTVHNGAAGETGETPNFAIGRVQTLPAGSNASATITGTAENPQLNLNLPRGDKGERGEKGDPGPTGATGATGPQGERGPEGPVGETGDTGPQGERGLTGNGIASVQKTGTEGSVDTYTITFTDGNTTTFTVTNSEVTPESMAQAIAEALQNYAEKDGAYEDLTAGNAQQLLSQQCYENAEPYIFRPTGGDSDREYLDAVVGGTLAWNQLVQNGNFTEMGRWEITQTVYETSVSNNVLTATAGPSANASSAIGAEKLNTVAGHKYLASIDVKYSKIPAIIQGSKFFFGSGGYDGIFGVVTAANTWQQIAGVFTRGTGGSDKVAIYPRYSTAQGEEGETAQFRNAVIFDLTRMFGTTVADYIYNLETATAGAGVAYFRKLFPEDYYEYNPGELLSVEGLQSHDMVGFNQWDEEWEVGAINADGTLTSQGNRRTTSFIHVLPNTEYYSSHNRTMGGRYAYFDANKNVIEYNGNGFTSQKFTTPSNAHYLRISLQEGYGTTYKHDICINLAHNNSRNGEYEPYEKHSYPLDSSVILRGIPKVDSNGVYWDGDRYLPDGTVERRYGVVDLGTLNWVLGGTYRNLFYALFPSAKYTVSTSNVADNIRITKYDIMPYSALDVNDATTKGIALRNTDTTIRIKDPSYATASDLKASLSGVYLVYELATPTTETAQPYRNLQLCDPDGTEEFTSTSIVPVGHETRYPENLRKKIEGLPWNFNSIIALTETTTKASKAYSVGDYLIYSNTLYRVASAIAAGGTITPGTNAIATTIMDEIKSLM